MEKKDFTSTPFSALVKLNFVCCPSTSIIKTSMKQNWTVKTGVQKKILDSVKKVKLKYEKLNCEIKSELQKYKLNSEPPGTL